MISGVYTPGIETVTLTDATNGPTHIVRTPYAATGNNAPVCVIIADLSGTATSTLTINRGTWVGGVFTAVQRIARISTIADLTVSESILYVTLLDEALQFIVTGDADTMAHVRIQGATVQVAP